MATALKFKIKSHVTVPLLKTPDSGVPIYVQITGAIFKAKPLEGARAAVTNADGTSKNEPPMLAHAINLETGEVCQIIVNSVLQTELQEAFPDDTYVGRAFEIKKFKMANGKRYATFQVAEIELDKEDADKLASVAPVAGRSAPHKTEAGKVDAPATAAAAETKKPEVAKK